VDRAADAYSECMLRLDDHYARGANTATLVRRQARCEARFERRTSRAIRLYGADRCTLLPKPFADRTPAVFVQTNKPLGNTIRVFGRAEDGTLTAAGEYETGGLGGSTVGAPMDALASQGSLVYRHGLLFAVNAGSNTVTLFRVHGNELERLHVVPSGGFFPVSIAVHRRLVYVLNAGGDGAVQGFRLDDGELSPIEGANRALGLGGANPPGFMLSPAQLGVSPNGRFLIVSTKHYNVINTFRIHRGGRLAERPVTSASATSVPFGFTFDRRGRVLVTGAGTSEVTRYRLDRGGALTPTGPSVSNGQAGLCWIQRVGHYFYVANFGSSTISAYRLDRNGDLLLVAAVAADTGDGPIDLTTSGGYLYVQNAAAGTIDGYEVHRDGSLTLVTTATGLPIFTDGNGMDGIAAS